MIVRILLLLTISATLFSAPFPSHAEASPDAETMAAALRQLLKEDPDIVLEILRAHRVEVFDIVREGLEDKKAQAEAQRIAEQIETPLVPAIDPSRPVLGPPEAPLVVVVYSDFLCHFCAEVSHTLGELMTRHPKKIRFYYKHNPLSDSSREAARYFEALGRQNPDLAWGFYTEAYRYQRQIMEQGSAALDEIAVRIGADMTRLARDLKDPAIDALIAADEAEAEEFGFEGAPAVVIDGVGLSGARTLEDYEAIAAQIENRRHEARNPASGTSRP